MDDVENGGGAVVVCVVAVDDDDDEDSRERMAVRVEGRRESGNPLLGPDPPPGSLTSPS